MPHSSLFLKNFFLFTKKTIHKAIQTKQALKVLAFLFFTMKKIYVYIARYAGIWLSYSGMDSHKHIYL